VVFVAQFCFAGSEVIPRSGALRISLASPLNYQVVQRETRTEGTLVIAGTILPETRIVLPLDTLEVRLTGKSITGALPGEWQPLPFDPKVPSFRGELTVPAGGWYRLEVRAVRQGKPVTINVVEHVGVGEVFVIAGQSNAANYDEKKLATQTGLVAAYDGTNWQLATDPEPGAGGKKGSFMPPFGDEMVACFHVPVGLVPTAIGSTSVREWLPTGIRFSVLPTLTRNVVTVAAGRWESSGEIYDRFTRRMKQLGPHGFRAVLWEQGESDADQAPSRTLPGELYRQYLEKLIRDSRRATGWEMPWFVAQVSYHNPADTDSLDIRAAQKAVWRDGVALQGPDADTLAGYMRADHGTAVHMSAGGQKALAHLWFEKVTPWLEGQLGESGDKK
jgi:Carbohydrate esterase, sialic acid-specific acetylesterase